MADRKRGAIGRGINSRSRQLSKGGKLNKNGRKQPKKTK